MITIVMAVITTHKNHSRFITSKSLFIYFVICIWVVQFKGHLINCFDNQAFTMEIAKRNPSLRNSFHKWDGLGLIQLA